MRTACKMFLPLLIFALFTSVCLFEVNQPDRPVNGSAAGGRTSYTIIPFMPSGADSIESRVVDLNETGQAVGWFVEPDKSIHGLHLDITSGDYTRLSGGENSTADGVNNFNQVVGRDGNYGAFWATPTAEPLALSPLPGQMRSWASQINDAGMVLGHSANDSHSPGSPVVWRVTQDHRGAARVAGPWKLEPLGDAATRWATGINEATNGTAKVVGWSLDDRERAVTWTVNLNEESGSITTGPPVSLGTLGLHAHSWSRGTAINDSGCVCGISDSYPFYTVSGGPLCLMPAPLEIHRGHPQSINEIGVVVGAIDLYSQEQSVIGDLRAYLWREGEAIELNHEINADSGWDNLRWANCINNAGIIGGWGKLDVERRGFLLLPKI